ncbi:MAG: hypothetical protein OXE87_10335 [Chloroflexi bacterium]|nr:hypothetical protein [Chloroflexota bacterium]
MNTAVLVDAHHVDLTLLHELADGGSLLENVAAEIEPLAHLHEHGFQFPIGFALGPMFGRFPVGLDQPASFDVPQVGVTERFSNFDLHSVAP